MIYTLTPNPALDYALYLSRLAVGETNRSSREQLDFGGKGINVSYILHELGVPTVALGFVAGFTGRALQEMLKEKGIVCDFILLPAGMTRINVKLKGESETEINAGGPDIPGEALRELYARLRRIRAGDTLVLAGSVPRSLPRDFYEQLLAMLQGQDIRVVVDAEGELLLRVLPYRPYLIKPNRAELCGLCGRELTGDDELVAAARELQDKGARNVLLSLGGEGALLLDEQGGIHRAAALGKRPVNTVGAGDSTVAGFLAAIEQGKDYGTALRLAMAAGGATACSPVLATREEIMTLFEE